VFGDTSGQQSAGTHTFLFANCRKKNSNMKKQLLLLVMMMLPMVASADTVYIFSNGIYYKLNTDDFVAEVTTIL